MDREDAHLAAAIAIAMIVGAIIGYAVCILVSTAVLNDAQRSAFDIEAKYAEIEP